MTKQTVTETRVRRSTEDVKAARIEREARLQEKANARAAKFAAMAKLAEEKAAAAKAKQAAIEANVSVRQEKAPLPTIKETVAKRMARELTSFIKQFGSDNGLSFEDVSPRMTRQGSGISIHLSGHVAGISVAAKRAVGASREAARFLQNHKMIGIKPSVLNKEVQLAGSAGSFKVLGLKGRANEVVLQKVGSEEIRSMPADEFKSHMVAG